jgi:undecaprenyl phosphate N,N'-diacetylbacillosamine 1-phosphate transferase
MYKLFIKRIFDFILALIGFLVGLPIFIFLTISLFFYYKGSPFFFQTRPGKNEKFFKIIKFKTMNDKKDLKGQPLADEFRLTKVGKFLRKSSLDEIPQLINILLGNMSFVGPRPLLVKYLPYYTNTEKRRHSVKPGITGLAQISGRNLLNWDHRLEKDIVYVNNISFMLDLTIIIKTINRVLTSKDIVVNPNSVIEDLDAIRSKN